MLTAKDVDPKGLIREGYRIEGITIGECRSIFLDWAIQVPTEATPKDHIEACLNIYATNAPDHPMTVTLQAGLEAPPLPRRRGGPQGQSNAVSRHIVHQPEKWYALFG